MYRDLIINLAIFISFLAVSGEFFKDRSIHSHSTRKNQILFGIGTGALAIILMFFSIKVPDTTTIVDLRNFTIILATMYGGPVSGGIAAGLCSFGRIAIFGVNISSVVAVMTFISIVISCILIRNTKLTSFMRFTVMNLTSIVIASVAFIYLIKDTTKLLEVLQFFWIISFGGGLIIYMISRYIAESNDNFKRLRLLEKVIETTQQGVSITDTNGNILFVNGGFTKITGYTLEETLGVNPRILKSGKHDLSFYQNMWDELAKTGQWSGEIWNKSKEGKIYPELLNISEVKDNVGHVMNYVAVFSDISKMKDTENKLLEANERLEKLSSLDGLTRIPNRRSFDASLESEWHRAIRYQHPISLIMLDIDYFKKFNDTYGHLEGDECLKKVASSLSKSVNRSTDVVARYGGEEFAIILHDTTKEDALIIAEKVRRDIESLCIPHQHSLVRNTLTISLGLATLVPTKGMLPAQIIDFADKALYKAKGNGRNQVQLYSNEL